MYTAEQEFKKVFYKLLKKSFYGKTMENVQNRSSLEIFEKDENKKMSKQQSKLTFNGTHKSLEKCESYTFTQIEIPKDKPNFLGFAILESSKLLMYETFYDKKQPYNDNQKIIQLQYMGCDGFALSIETQNIINGSKKFGYLFDFSNLDENHELFSNKNKKVAGKLNIEFPKNNWTDEIICLRSEAFSFKCNDENTNKLKGVSKSQTKLINFEE